MNQSFSSSLDRPQVTYVQHSIETQGEIRTHDKQPLGHIHRKGQGVVCIYFSLISKRAVFSGAYECDDRGPLVELYADEETLHVDDSKKGTSTLILFPEYVGWSVFSGSVSKSTLRLVLVSPNRSPPAIATPSKEQMAFELGEWFTDCCKFLGHRAYDQRELCRMSAQLDKSPVTPDWMIPFGIVMADACDRHPTGGQEMIDDVRESLVAAVSRHP